MSSRSSTTTRRMTSSPWTSGAEGPLGLRCLSVGRRGQCPATVRLPPTPPLFAGPNCPSALFPLTFLAPTSLCHGTVARAHVTSSRPVWCLPLSHPTWGLFGSGHSPNGRRGIAVQHYTPLGAANAVRMVCTLPSFPLSDPFRCKIAEDHPPRLCLGGASPNLRPSQSLSRAILTLSTPIH